MAGFSAIGRVLSYRNARIYFGASVLCWTGLWVQRIAVDWLAWELTHSPAWVGALVFCGLFPSVIVSPIAGAIADRVDRVRMATLVQTALLIHTLLLLTLIATGLMRVEILAVLELFSGLMQAGQQPARQAMVPGLVPRSELTGSVALNSLTYNLARFIGPAISGPVVALWGIKPAIMINALAGFLTVLSMYWLRIPDEFRHGCASGKSVLVETLAGFNYIARHPGMGPLFFFAAMMCLCLRSVPEMLAPFVARIFERGADGLAILASTMGLAALIGGILVAMRGRVQGMARVAVASGMLLAVATAGFVSTNSFEVGVLCIGLMGAATTMHGIAAQTLLQSACGPAMLGRVMSLWGLIVRALPATGALIFGIASEWLGLRIPVLISVALAATVCAWMWHRLPRIAAALEGPG
ncbi:MAG: MFS transporter [Acetobacteraceae bacterium]|nr:MFS transporter [Acetobacteraceae bacterium]